MLFVLKVMQKDHCTTLKSLVTLQSVESNTEYKYRFRAVLEVDDLQSTKLLIRNGLYDAYFCYMSYQRGV